MPTKNQNKAILKQNKATLKNERKLADIARQRGGEFAEDIVYRFPPKTSWLTGSEGGVQNVPINTKNQTEVLNALLSQGIGEIRNPLSSPYAHEALDTYRNEIVPSIGQRFASLGNGRRSSNFNAAITGAGQQLARNIPSIARTNAFPLVQAGLSPRYSQYMHQASPSSLPGRIGSSLSQAVQGGLQGFSAGGREGAIAGAIGGGTLGFLNNSGGGGGLDLSGYSRGKSSGGGGSPKQKFNEYDLMMIKDKLGSILSRAGINAQQGSFPLGDEALQELIDAIVGSKSAKEILAGGG